MSSTAPQVRRSSGWLDPAALRRARLRAVPPRRTSPASAGRLPFVTLVTLLLIGGVVGLLMFNTSMQQAAFSQTSLEEQATNLAAREQTMKMQLERMQDPQRVALEARKLGMVIPGRPAMLYVPSGKVKGSPEPAGRQATPPLYPRNPAPKAAEKPAEKTQQPAH